MGRAAVFSQRLHCCVADAHGPYSDKIYLPPSFLAGLLAECAQELPSPVTVRIAGTMVHCGVREFSSEEGSVGVPTSLLEQINSNSNSNSNSKNGMVTVEHVQLEKGEFAQLRALDPEEESQNIVGNLRTLLETHMRTNLTVLFVGETIRFPVGGRRVPLSFEVMSLEPDTAVDIIDTDLTVDIISESGDQSSSNGTDTDNVISVDARPLDIEAAPGATRVLILHIPAHTTAVDVVLECKPGHDASLVASRLVRDASEADNDWHDYSAPSQLRKELHIERVQQQQQGLPDGACNIYVGVIADATSSSGFKGTISATTSQNKQEVGADAAMDDTKRCPNCKTDVPKGNYDIHTLFCERHNFRCDGCGAVLRRNSDEAKIHWHCDICYEPGVLGDEAKHARFFHTPCSCTCDENEDNTFTSVAELAQHRRTDCSHRLIECRFCKLAIVQGPIDSSYEAQMLGMRAHEWSCGNRSISCARCKAYVRIQHVAAHMRMHELSDKKRHASMVHCANKLCDRERATAGNPLGLCATCYGPLYSNAWDPGYKKLLGRLTRMLFAQITQGCGNPECKNRGECCATGLTESEAAAKIVPIVRAYAPLTNTAGSPRIDYDSIDLRLCIR